MEPAAPPIICLMGPTAAGKTDLAIALCEHLPCEIISVDSALVYRDMNIGTAKPDNKTLAQFPHRLVDIRDPAEPYSAANFRVDALAEMAEISARGKIPLLVGGTMLYYKVLLYGIGELPAADPVIRSKISADAQRLGWQAIHDQLAKVDPDSAARIHPNDPQRLQRALEVYLISGISMTQWQLKERRSKEGQLKERQAQTNTIQKPLDIPYRAYQIALVPIDRTILHQRIAQRFQQMLALGFVQEVEALYQRGDLHIDLPSIRAVGYRQVWQFLDAKISYDEMIERAIIATRQLCKRQLTWLRSWPDLQQVQIDYESSIKTKVQESVGKTHFLDQSLRQALNFLSDITI